MTSETSAEIENQQLKRTIAEIRSQIKNHRLQEHAKRITPRPPSEAAAIRLETNTANAQDEVLHDLNVFPSTNWQDRLLLVRTLLPHIEFDNISSAPGESGCRVVCCTLLSPLLFLLQLRFHIDSDSAINKIEASNDGILLLRLLAPQYALVVTKNYIPRNKVQVLVYSLNSLAACVHQRTNSFVELTRKYPDLVSNVDQNSLGNNSAIYGHLKSIDEIVLTLPETLSTIRVVWTIALDDEITGECGNTINLIGPDHKANELFQMLLRSSSILNAVTSVLSNCYNYT